MGGSEEALAPQGPRLGLTLGLLAAVSKGLTGGHHVARSPPAKQVGGWSQKREALKRRGRGPGSVRAQRNWRPGCMAGASQDPQKGEDV